jgi:flagellar basal body-associated protein FliL
MAKTFGKKTVDGGLEIDKISLTNLALTPPRKSTTQTDPAGRPANSEGAYPGVKKTNLVVLAVLAVLVLLMALTALFKPQEFSITFRQGTEKPNAPLKNYLRIGPITTTLANEDIVKFSIDIECENAKLKEWLAGKDALIRDKVIAVLTEPGTEAFLVKRDYESVRAKILERLSDLPVSNIYFSELLLY